MLGSDFKLPTDPLCQGDTKTSKPHACTSPLPTRLQIGDFPPPRSGKDPPQSGGQAYTDCAQSDGRAHPYFFSLFASNQCKLRPLWPIPRPRGHLSRGLQSPGFSGARNPQARCASPASLSLLMSGDREAFVAH